MQCACTILQSVACPTVQYFFTLSHKLGTFDRKLANVNYVLIFSTNFSEMFPILIRIELSMIK